MPDIQSELQKVTLEKEASLRKPLTERIWNYLKENPNKDCRAISEALGEAYGPVSSTVVALEKRNLLVKTRKGVQDPAARGARGNLWSCSGADNPPKFYRKSKKVVKAEAAVYAPPAVKSVDEKAQDVAGGLSLELAHAVYLKLKTYFDPKVL